MKTCFLGGNGFTIQGDLIEFDDAGERVPAVGLTNGTGFLALTEGGSPIAGLSGTLVERPGRAGRYFISFAGASIDTALASITADGDAIWQCIQFGSEFEDWRQVRVRDRR